MTVPFQFKRAERKAMPIKAAIAGPSGSGKTEGMLKMLSELVGPQGKIAVIDTENGSASLYSDRYAFDTLVLAAPYTSDRYIQAMQAAVDAGYDAVGIDSISHQWDGDGGILRRKEAKDVKGGNQWTNWADFSKEHECFRSKILSLPIHLVATIRSKIEYIQEETNGKKSVKKVGMKPITREGMDYEFSLLFDVDIEHRAYAAKDRTGLFGDPNQAHDLMTADVGQRIVKWLSSGKAIQPASAKTLGAIDTAVERLEELDATTGAQAAEWVSKNRGNWEYSEEVAAAALDKLQQRVLRATATFQSSSDVEAIAA